jgi:hypothetical protein
MKTLALSILLSLFLKPIAHAAPTPPLKWMDIEPATILKLKGDLKINETLTLAKGSTLAVNEVSPLDSIRVQQINLVLFPCRAPLDETRVEMTILDDTYGFEMQKSCKVSLYLEFKDFNRDSYFEVVEP